MGLWMDPAQLFFRMFSLPSSTFVLPDPTLSPPPQLIHQSVPVIEILEDMLLSADNNKVLAIFYCGCMSDKCKLLLQNNVHPIKILFSFCPDIRPAQKKCLNGSTVDI